MGKAKLWVMLMRSSFTFVLICPYSMSTFVRGRSHALPIKVSSEALRKAALFNLGLNVVASIRPTVDWVAHLGGGLMGAALLLLVIRPKLSDDARTPLERSFTVLASLCVAALLLSLIVAMLHGKPWLPIAPETLAL